MDSIPSGTFLRHSVQAETICHSCQQCKKNVKSFSSHKADLRLISPQPDTSLHCKTRDTGLMHRAVCLFTSQLSLVLIAPTHGGMARLSCQQ